MTYAVELNK